MTKQKVKNHKALEIDTYYISENCSSCGQELINIKDIWTDNESGNYYCEECKSYHQINAVKCRDF